MVIILKNKAFLSSWEISFLVFSKNIVQFRAKKCKSQLVKSTSKIRKSFFPKFFLTKILNYIILASQSNLTIE